MSDAQRQRRRRDRERDGLAIWGVEVDENKTARALIETGFLERAANRQIASACCSALARSLAFAASPSPSLRVKSELSSQRHSMSALPLKADIKTNRTACPLSATKQTFPNRLWLSPLCAMAAALRLRIHCRSDGGGVKVAPWK